MKVIQAKNVEDAVNIALDLRGRGEYDWFRGQVQCWDPASSLERRLREKKLSLPDYENRLSRIVEWLGKVPDLAYLTEEDNVNDLYAVLQHYGWPTPYIDFTTDPGVAGFFAADVSSPPKDQIQSVIYCLNTKDIVDFYGGHAEFLPGMQVETITVDVANLWRLKAQGGHFIYTNHPWYKIYDMDRIVFPWTGIPAYPRREDVYPLHKSPLEQRLDEYFLIERAQDSTKNLRKLSDDGKLAMIFYELEPLAPYESEYFNDALGRLESWSMSSLESWTRVSRSDFPSGPSYQISLKFRCDVGAPDLRQQAYTAVSGLLRRDENARQKPIEWRVSLAEELNCSRIDAGLRLAWNGMRHLPFSDEQISHALSLLVEIMAGLRMCPETELYRAVEKYYEKSVQVEFGTAALSVSRGFCSSQPLLSAIDPSWTNKLKDNVGTVSATKALRITNTPNLIYDFELFADIFAREIIPGQIAVGREVVLFNPAELVVFGLP